ncbi:MAG: hypothetical protein Q9M13_03625, partial [Mariprofundales bacterium]|nr:hypothetical protein [Mariprofundales bacterium]
LGIVQRTLSKLGAGDGSAILAPAGPYSIYEMVFGGHESTYDVEYLTPEQDGWAGLAAQGFLGGKAQIVLNSTRIDKNDEPRQLLRVQMFTAALSYLTGKKDTVSLAQVAVKMRGLLRLSDRFVRVWLKELIKNSYIATPNGRAPSKATQALQNLLADIEREGRAARMMMDERNGNWIKILRASPQYNN